jgi:TrmH family RNA methyltransferase
MNREPTTENHKPFFEITSKDNSRLKFARLVRDRRDREHIFIEGVRLVEEAVAATLEIVDYFFTTEFAQNPRGRNLLDNLQNSKIHGAVIGEKLLESLAETKSPQGIVVITRQPVTGKDVVENALVSASNPLLIVLHKLNNPANIGAILRTAEAAGAHSTILTAESADAFSPKSLRAAMGSAFRLPLWTNVSFLEIIEFCRAKQIKTVSSDLKASKSHFEIDWTKPCALFIGSEAHGLDSEEIALIDDNLKILMSPFVESLNAAVACGVILYEAVRQRENLTQIELHQTEI